MARRLAFGAVVGAIAGVVVGVMMAPKSGKEIRGDITKKATELKDKASDETRAATNDLKSKLKK